MSQLGFKRIDRDNWLKPDEVMRHFAGMECVEDYLAVVLAPKLSEKVPQDIRGLFEVARGALLYGYLFYPLYALAAGQLFRVGEAGIAHACAQLGMPNDKRRFVDHINWMVEKGVFSRGEGARWHVLRQLRNLESHATRQSILAPGMAIGILNDLARDISALFDKTSGD